MALSRNSPRREKLVGAGGKEAIATVTRRERMKDTGQAELKNPHHNTRWCIAATLYQLMASQKVRPTALRRFLRTSTYLI